MHYCMFSSIPSLGPLDAGHIMPPKAMTIKNVYQFSSVQFIRSVMYDCLQPHELQHTKPPCPSLTPGVHSEKYL